MNAGTVVRHTQAATLDPVTLLSSAQAHVSDSATGKFLYRYDLARIQAMRSWEAHNAREYSAVTVHSTFQATATRVSGAQATVTGNESLFLDETIQNDGLLHHFSATKQAAMKELKQAGRLIGFGQTNHSSMLIMQHTVTLRRTSSGWVIEYDLYQDPLVPGTRLDHQTLAMTATPQDAARGFSSAVSLPSMINLAPKKKESPSLIHYLRWQAISYADTFANTCVDWRNGYNYNGCYYMSQGVDCADFVSQALFDPSSGGDLGWSDAWHPQSYDFVNADGLRQWALYRWAANSYGTNDYGSANYWQNVYVYPGDLFFYSWDMGPLMDHTAISAAMDANGNNYVDAHTYNQYHAPWNLYTTSAGFYFVVMNDWV